MYRTVVGKIGILDLKISDFTENH
eukprot:COSAG01_NODE_62541_length_284_cov_0.664865_1_plen_23_part_10